jgi:hypothetical protein
LRALEQWVCWRREDRGGKPTKVPYCAESPSSRASTTDPATWADYATAAAVQDVDGVGFVFTEGDPFCGIDLDACMTDGRLDPQAAAVVLTLDSYSEVSPSGAGAHCIVRAKLNGGRRRSGNVEMYDAGRYFCMTGNHLPETPTTIEARQAELEKIRSEVFPAEQPQAALATPAAVNSADDHELIERASNAKNGADFARLYRGSWDGYDSHSEADLALCNMLAFWAERPDPARVDRLFRASGLMREKWVERHGAVSYGELTIARALEGRTDFYTPRERAAPPVVAAHPDQQSATPATYVVEVDAKGLKLPETPALQDVAGQCAWLTAVLALDPAHPITSGERQGQLGPDCHIELRRADAWSLRFEPATRLNTPLKLVEALTWRALSSDGVAPPYKGRDCQRIAHVVRMLCGAVETLSDEQECAGIIGTFLSGAVQVERAVTTYGNAAQRYEAAIALRREIDQASGRPIGQPRYARDANTGELLIAVADLAEAARRHTGTSLPHGWLDARIAALDWRRITLQGYALPGRDGRKGPHARINAYRGHLTTRDDEPVNT